MVRDEVLLVHDYSICLISLYAEMRDGLLADDTEYASKKLKEQLKCVFSSL